VNNNIEQLLAKQLHGLLSPEEEQILNTWLHESNEHLEEYSQYIALWHSRHIVQTGQTNTTEAALQIFRKNMESEMRTSRRVFIYKVMRYAAVLVAAIGLVYYIWGKIADLKPVKQIMVQTLAGEMKEITLPDSTKVWINSNSSITYPESFNAKQRKVDIKGEVYFDVKHIDNHSFIVNTEDINIRVLGTVFNINTQTGRGITEVTLVNGKVALEDKEGNILGNLVPGQMAAFNHLNKSLKINDVPVKEVTQWQIGTVNLRNATVAEIIQSIEDVYNVKVKLDTKLAGKSKMQKRYNFVFRRSQPVDTVFEMLRFIAPVEYIKKGETGTSQPVATP
jgi:ferric-dicitrate binding protein FerR (iron transport regulator)